MLQRRPFLAALASAGAWLPARASDDVLARLRAGGVVLAFRHALAPGTFDPPGFTLGDCSTQRNLSDEGRAQARRLGVWFTAQGLKAAAVKSSPWCRCMDTATLAFGSAQAWPALGSPRGSPETTSRAHLDELRRALQAVGRQPGRLEVWVTHMFVLADLARENTASGEGLVLRGGPGGEVQVLGRVPSA